VSIAKKQFSFAGIVTPPFRHPISLCAVRGTLSKRLICLLKWYTYIIMCVCFFFYPSLLTLTHSIKKRLTSLLTYYRIILFRDSETWSIFENTHHYFCVVVGFFFEILPVNIRTDLIWFLGFGVCSMRFGKVSSIFLNFLKRFLNDLWNCLLINHNLLLST
jgi:hypothetical protein